MRRALLPAFLLVLGGVVLGATVFREQLVHAATTPFQNVVVTNTATNPVLVQQSGTSSVSGTVKIDATGNTVSLNSTDSANLAHLANIDAATGGTVSSVCNGFFYDLDAGSHSTLCSMSGSWDVSTIVAAGMDDNVLVGFYDGVNNLQLTLPGSDADGTSVYQLNLPRPLVANEVIAICGNIVEDCRFTLNVLGTSN